MTRNGGEYGQKRDENWPNLLSFLPQLLYQPGDGILSTPGHFQALSRREVPADSVLKPR